MNCFHSFFEYSHTFISLLIAQSLHQHPVLVLVCVLHWSNTKHGCWHIFSHRVISPRLWVGWFCEQLIFRGGGAYCWKSSILVPPYEQTFLSMSALPCSACNAFLIPNATLCRKHSLKCLHNNTNQSFKPDDICKNLGLSEQVH